jgi:hypothetical protein
MPIIKPGADETEVNNVIIPNIGLSWIIQKYSNVSILFTQKSVERKYK